MTKKKSDHVEDLDDPQYDTLEVVPTENVLELNPEAAKPEPNVGDPDYDWSTHYGTDELYTHTFPNGTVVAIKTFEAIYTKTWLYSIRGLQTNVDFEFAAIDRAACPTAQEVLESLDDADSDPIADLFKAWTSKGTSRGKGDEGLTPGK